MCPDCDRKNEKIYQLSLLYGVKKRQNDLLFEDLKQAKIEIKHLEKYRQQVIELTEIILSKQSLFN